MMLRARSVVAGLAVAGLVLAGCGSANPSTSAAPSTAPSVPAASTPSAGPPSVAPPSAAPSTAAASSGTGGLPTTGRIAVAEKGYAITLPPAWTRVDLGSEGLKDIMAAGASALPKDMQDMLAGQVGQMAASGVSLFAFRQPSGSLAPGTTLNVLSLPGLPVPLDTFESLIVTQLKSVVGQDTQISTARVKGPAGEFLRLTYDLKVGTSSVGTVQYLFLSQTQQYVISCGTPGPISTVQAECESIATSLEIL
jgi:hypothetical protein